MRNKLLSAALCVLVYSGFGFGSCPIQKDEEVIFFPTYGHLNTDRSAWVISIHGWVYKPDDDSKWREAFIKKLGRHFVVPKKSNSIFKKRLQLFLADNIWGKSIPIQIGNKTVQLKKSKKNGHFEDVISISKKEISENSSLHISTSGWLTYQTIRSPDDDRIFFGNVQLLEETGTSVISDIDDTIKVTEVNNRNELLQNTFVREFRAVPTMASLYNQWEKEGATFHYISGSVWQLAPGLLDFLKTNNFPPGSLQLRSVRWKDQSFLNLFKSPEIYKFPVIENILRQFPNRRFILVGDSGESDPKIYAELAKRYPRQIEKILIRDVTTSQITVR